MTPNALNEAALLRLADRIEEANAARPVWIDPVAATYIRDLLAAKADAQPTSAVNQASAAQGEVVAWDVFEHRLYGAPGEKSHRVLWVENYRLADGSMPDLDVLLEAARSGGICKSVKTIHIMPLYTHPASPISAAAQAVPTTGGDRDER